MEAGLGAEELQVAVGCGVRRWEACDVVDAMERWEETEAVSSSSVESNILFNIIYL